MSPLTLCITVGHGNVCVTTVGGGSASVVLNSAAALEGCTLVQEGSAINRKGTVRGVILNDWGSSTAQGTSEGLDVVAGSENAGEAGEHGKSDSVLHFDGWW